jgi:N-acetyl-alpha-D-muramate 1-phosphate uridylyltransferase
MTPTALMLFAAGFGTRMGALVADRPKPLIPVAGRCLLDHALAQADGLGVTRIVVNAHYLSDQVQGHLAGREGVQVVVENPILETGGGLRAALPLLGPGPVFTLNSDAVWTGPSALATLRAAWDPDRMEALLLVVPAARALGHPGRDFVLCADGRLTRGAGWAYTGAQIVNPERLAQVDGDVFSLNRLWDMAAGQGRLFGVEHPGMWADVGRPENIAQAEKMLEQGLV